MELEADAGLTVSRLVEQERARLQPDDRRVVETLLDLGGSPALSVGLLGQAGRARRQVIWQNTLRHVLLTVARLPELGAQGVDELVGAAERARCEAAVVIAEPEPAVPDLEAVAGSLAGAAPRLAIWVPAPLDAGEREFAAELFCRQVVLRQAMGEGRGRLLDFLRRSSESDVARAREVVRRCYFQGRLVAAELGAGLDLPALSGQPFDAVLRGLVAPLLHALHPRHRDVQPHAELVSDRHVRRLISVALAEPRLTVAAADREGLRPQVEAFLVPLGLARKRGEAYVLAPDPARSPAVAELLRLTATGPVERAGLAAELAGGEVGLSEPELLLLLNGAVRSGIVEATRGRRRVEAPFLSLEEVERVGPGELLAPELRGRLAELGDAVGPGPHEPWDAQVQQAGWDRARVWLEARRDEAARLRDGMERLAGSALHADAQLGGLPEDLGRVERLLGQTDPQAPPRRGLEALVTAAGEPAALLEAARRVAAASRFCATGLAPLMGTVAYLRDPALRIPDVDAYDGVREARGEALGLAARALPLAAEERGPDVLDAAERARRAFAATYEAEHERFAAASGPGAAAPVTPPSWPDQPSPSSGGRRGARDAERGVPGAGPAERGRGGRRPGRPGPRGPRAGDGLSGPLHAPGRVGAVDAAGLRLRLRPGHGAADAGRARAGGDGGPGRGPAPGGAGPARAARAAGAGGRGPGLAGPGGGRGRPGGAAPARGGARAGGPGGGRAPGGRPGGGRAAPGAPGRPGGGPARPRRAARRAGRAPPPAAPAAGPAAGLGGRAGRGGRGGRAGGGGGRGR